VVLPTVLLTHLRELSSSLDGHNEALSVSLRRLVSCLRAATPSYTGLELRLVSHGWPVTLTEYSDEDVPAATSLRLDLALVLTGLDRRSSIVFYAAAPGALVDLAADLGYVLGVAGPGAAFPHSTGTAAYEGERVAIELDGDLPPASRHSGLVGMAEFSTINRAVGLLIGQGHSAEEARAILHRGAATEGVEWHVFAARLVHA
jgi:hypothetical protein